MLTKGADRVFYGNDVVTSKIPDDTWDDMEFLMPLLRITHVRLIKAIFPLESI
jgi:hypothetical protein